MDKYFLLFKNYGIILQIVNSKPLKLFVFTNIRYSARDLQYFIKFHKVYWIYLMNSIRMSDKSDQTMQSMSLFISLSIHLSQISCSTEAIIFKGSHLHFLVIDFHWIYRKFRNSGEYSNIEFWKYSNIKFCIQIQFERREALLL